MRSHYIYVTITIIITLFTASMMPTSMSAQEDALVLRLRAGLGDGLWETVWSPDSTKVAVYRRIDASLHVYDIEVGRLIYEFSEENDIQDVAWLPDNTRLMIGTTAGVVKVVDLETGLLLVELFHPDAIYHIRVSEDGEQTLVSGGFETARLWNIRGAYVEFELDPDESIIRAELDEDIGRIRTFSSTGFMSIWDSENGDRLLTIEHDDWIYGSTWNADASQVVTYGQDHTARITDVESGKTILDLSHDNVVYDAAWLEDETQVMTFSGDGFIHIWTLDGTEIRTLPYQGFDLLEDGARVLSRNTETMQIWDLSTGEDILAFVHEEFVQDYAINSDEILLLTRTFRGSGHIWDLETGDEVWRFEGQLGEAVWSSDGNMIATVTRDGMLDIWGLSQ